MRCGKYRRGLQTRFCWESQKEWDHLEDLDIEYYNIKIDLRETDGVLLDWTDLAQNWKQWRDLLKTILQLQFPENVKKFLSSWADSS
jgi:hypothetical protein